ncbi:MAG: hypothetical protein K9L68_15025, partial [Spirochaetales bacterium]|nr:hypothetical protein [Spirochaetales bacterium]
ELEPSVGMGIFTLGSVVTDRAEPSEALRATTVFQVGFPEAIILLSERQIDSFERGFQPRGETSLRGQRGAFLLSGSVELQAGQTSSWILAADVDRNPADVVELRRFLLQEKNPAAVIREDISRGVERLKMLVGRADGFQLGNDPLITDRHYSNVLFNIMRGGVFISGYDIEKEDFLRFLGEWNRDVKAEHGGFLDFLPGRIVLGNLMKNLDATGDGDLLRLGLEYLPLSFSRRHGDPSRPWNTFVIDVVGEGGEPKIAYQGNWRDIFQNWEALAVSYPRYLNGIIAKFLNASTADGYNPYRISQKGIDWEILDPEDPWSNIGYWGDHQIVYLCRLLELSFRYDPEGLRAYLDRRIYTFADIPYRIRGFQDILADPHSTIVYDTDREKEIQKRVERIGADGKLLQSHERPLKASMLEKLLITLLTKLSNLVPGGGIWMNTQRPEWNDANNALAGYGLSIVTVAYIHRFVLFLRDLIPPDGRDIFVARGLYDFFWDMSKSLSSYDTVSPKGSAKSRMDFLRGVGIAGERYRQRVYEGTFNASEAVLSIDEIRAFLATARKITAASLRANKRPDGLYHSYNIMELREDGLLVEPLDEMLEGQVAVLSSGFLSAGESISLLDTLEKSRLYRPDQGSYILYPDRCLPSFLEKNRIPADRITRSWVLKREVLNGAGRVIEKDVEGFYHFNGDLRNARLLSGRLEEIEKQGGKKFSQEEKEEFLALYEETFHHRRFTGRSGTFFKYEGLGSIYWHMVSKLQLAVLEISLALCGDSKDPAGRSEECREKLKEHYGKIKEGIGVHKSPAEYGAFPMDPYSHTPGFAGVQQPGMTGQVKEDVISRFLELGVMVGEGRVRFRPVHLDRSEFLTEERDFFYSDVKGKSRSIRVGVGSLAFSFCGVPVVYHAGDGEEGRLEYGGEIRDFIPSEGLMKEESRDLFDRNGKVGRIDVTIN